MIMIQILQTPTFAKQIKKLHANECKDLNLVVKTVLEPSTRFLAVQSQHQALFY